jgi:3-isopropylmalate/(R)-2-methylmalate dehydratase small subunit
VSGASRIARVSGTAMVLHGDDIDTDRIIPARFLKSLTFDGLEAHLFEDDRHQAAAAGARHPFDRPEHRGAAILIAGANFGCGSSREHAPQALQRRGIRAVAAESFAEIFAGNALAIGLPCVTADRHRLASARQLIEAVPGTPVEIDLQRRLMTAGAHEIPIVLPDAARQALLSGGWDATGLLLERPEEVDAIRARLPYLQWSSRSASR